MKTKNKFWFDRYKHYRNVLNLLVTKKKHLRYFFQKHHYNSKKIWIKVSEILYSKTKMNEDIYLSNNGITLLDITKVASKFNDYFLNIFQNLLKNLGKTNNQFQDYVKNPSERSLLLKETEPGEVLQILKSLNIKKSTDIFDISPKMIKTAAKVLKTHIDTLINYSINQGIFPNNLKIAHIHPIHKAISKLMCSSYRPISFFAYT